LIDPETGRETRGGALVEDGLIKALGPRSSLRTAFRHGAVRLPGDCSRGLIDLRASIGDGVANILASAAAGGVTTILADPPLDDPPSSRCWCKARAKKPAFASCRSRAQPGLDGRGIAELGLLQEAGAVAFSEEGAASPAATSCAAP